MYYISNVSERVRVPPDLFGMDLNSAITKILKERLEGNVFESVGIVLGIHNVDTSGEGVVLPTDGAAYYNVKFEILSFLPKVNEVIEADVKEIAKFGVFASVGPFQGLLHISQIGKETYRYDKRTKVIISRDKKKSLKKGDVLILKIATVSLKKMSQDTKIGLTMRAEGLGKLDWLNKKSNPSSGKKDSKKSKNKKSKKGGKK